MIPSKKNSSSGQASIDTGWGLIYRLNFLLTKAEDASLAGNFEKWNFVLDRVFVNLCYKGGMEIVFDECELGESPSKIVSIKLPDEEEMVFLKFKDMIREIKLKSRKAILKKNKREYEEAKELHYKTLLTKDIWLRKVMMDRGLYLKEFDFDPTKAMWGG
jgi:hypothetical protein